MKKLILTAIGLVAGATLVHAQGGDISWVDLNADMLTSTSTYTSNFTGTATGLAKTGATSAYYFALLAATSTTAADAGNPAGPDWAALSPVTANGSTTPSIGYSSGAGGGVSGPGAGTGFSSSLTAGTTYDIMVVGWSSNFGTTWAQVSGLFADYFSSDTTITGYAGYSNIGTLDPTTAPAAAATIFGGSAVGSGKMILYTVTPTVTPEPTTLALAGLGGLSMLFLRRRKA